MIKIKKTFGGVINIIETAHKRAYQKVNDELAGYIQSQYPGIKGFNRHGLYRMKQFFEIYIAYEKVSPLVTQISWTNNLLILSGTKSI